MKASVTLSSIEILIIEILHIRINYAIITLLMMQI